MEENKWVIQEIEALKSQATSYEEKAIYQQLQGLINEQHDRLTLLEGQLEGTLWSPQEWGV